MSSNRILQVSMSLLAIIVSWSFLTMTSYVCSAQEATTQIDNWYHYEQGMRMVQAKQWGQAEKEFRYYFNHPEYHRHMFGVANYGLGVMYQQKGNFEMAKDFYMKALQEDLHPTVSVTDKVYENLGAIYLKNKDYPKAIESYKKAVEKSPNNGLAHYYLGMSYLRSGDLENAEKESQESKKKGITFTGLDEGLAEAKNPSMKKNNQGDEAPVLQKTKKRKVAK